MIYKVEADNTLRRVIINKNTTEEEFLKTHKDNFIKLDTELGLDAIYDYIDGKPVINEEKTKELILENNIEKARIEENYILMYFDLTDENLTDEEKQDILNYYKSLQNVGYDYPEKNDNVRKFYKE